MSRVLSFSCFGGPEVLEFTDEVRFKVAAFALNRADLLMMAGHHYTLPDFPSRLGSEACGEVVEVGSEVTSFKVGDRVSSIPFHTTEHGVQGEYATVPQGFLTAWPDGLSAQEACAVWMQYLTAYFPFCEIKTLKQGDSVLIAEATSSAGQGAIQIAKALGVNVIATTRTTDKVAYLHSIGVDSVIVTSETENLADAILTVTDQRGVALAYDPVGGSFTGSYAPALAWGGVVILYGLLSGEPTEVPIVSMVRRNAVLHPYSMFNHVTDVAQLQRGIDFITRAIADNKLRPKIDRVFTFGDSVAAYNYMLSNQQHGKIVVSLTQDVGS